MSPTSDIVLYTIIQFPSTPAITTSIVISVGIVLCGCAMLHNIVVWQRVSEYFFLKEKLLYLLNISLRVTTMDE